MTAAEVAKLFNAKKVGKGKWIAKCTGHDDKKPSLTIAEGRRVPVVLKCMSMNCDVRDILRGAGLTWGALFEGKPTPEIRRRVRLQQTKEAMEREWVLYEMLSAIERHKHRYWMAAARRVKGELFWVRWDLEREVVEQEIAEWVLHQRLQCEEWREQEYAKRFGRP